MYLFDLDFAETGLAELAWTETEKASRQRSEHGGSKLPATGASIPGKGPNLESNSMLFSLILSFN